MHVFPRLYQIADQKAIFIAEAGHWEANRWFWHLSWRRTRFDWEEEEINRLFVILNSINLIFNKEDKLCWGFKPDGAFSVKSFTTELEKSFHIAPLCKLPPHLLGIFPPKVEMFLWLAINRKTPTKVLLKSRNILNREDDIKCVLCGQSEESIDHLFVHCSKSVGIWNLCLNWWGISWVSPKSLSELIIMWSEIGKKIADSHVWNSLLGGVIWSLWLIRNQIQFQNASFDQRNLMEIIKIRVCLWLKAKFPLLSYPLSSMSLNIHLIDVENRIKISREPSVWCPPPVGCVKFNTDGAAKGKPGAAGIGGVLRDHSGEILHIFSCSIGVEDSNIAEYLAIGKALCVFGDSSLAKNVNLVVESDSTTALAWFKNGSSPPWKLWSSHNKFLSAMASMKSVSFVHTLRENNTIADHLAKTGINRSISIEDWFI